MVKLRIYSLVMWGELRFNKYDSSYTNILNSTLSHTVHPLINKRPITGQLGSGKKSLVKLDLASLASQANTSAREKH